MTVKLHASDINLSLFEQSLKTLLVKFDASLDGKNEEEEAELSREIGSDDVGGYSSLMEQNGNIFCYTYIVSLITI